VGTTRRSGGVKGFKHVWKSKFGYLNDDFDAKQMDLSVANTHSLKWVLATDIEKSTMCSVLQGLPTTLVVAEFLHTLNLSEPLVRDAVSFSKAWEIKLHHDKSCSLSPERYYAQ
jgi:hypothetical protein